MVHTNNAIRNRIIDLGTIQASKIGLSTKLSCLPFAGPIQDLESGNPIEEASMGFAGPSNKALPACLTSSPSGSMVDKDPRQVKGSHGPNGWRLMFCLVHIGCETNPAVVSC